MMNQLTSPLTTATEEGGERDEYRTPSEIFDGLGCEFDLDPCSPSHGPCYVPAKRRYTRHEDGLLQKWSGFVWMNPPFGPRNGQVPWLKKFFDHREGIGLANALTSAGWFHEWMPNASGLFFPRGKTQFVRPSGEVAKQPASGIVLFSAGPRGREILCDCKLPGMFFTGGG